VSNRRSVTAHGKLIEVEDLDTPTMIAPATKKAKRQEEFAIVPLQWAAGIAKDTETQRALVWIVLLYLSWKAKNKTFPVSNVIVAPYGIGQDTKLRALADLEAVGRITVQQNPGCAPLVTLIGFPNPR
jgi:hypothetical protein